MSEYASSKHSADEIPQEMSIFDDALLDDMAAKLGSSDEAYRRLGIKKPDYVAPMRSQASVEGAAVDLGVRALAIHGIIEGISYRNKANGAQLTSQIEDSEFNKRYKSPEDVLSGMRYSSSRMRDKYEKHLDSLNASDALIAAGFNKADVQFTRNRLIDEIKPFELTGRPTVDRRQKFDAKAQHTAKAVRNH